MNGSNNGSNNTKDKNIIIAAGCSGPNDNMIFEKTSHRVDEDESETIITTTYYRKKE